MRANWKNLILIAALALAPLPATAAADAGKTADWQRLEQRGEFTALFDDILTPQSKDDYVAGMDFLKSRVMAHAPHPGYYTSYAQLLWATGDKANAAIMASSAILILQTDKARCKDITAGQTRIRNSLAAIRDPLLYIATLPASEQNRIFDASLHIEDAMKRRPVNTSLCMSGMIGMQQKMKLAQEGKIQATRQGDAYALPDDPRVQIETLPDPQWHAARDKIRAGFADYILGKKGLTY